MHAQEVVSGLGDAFMLFLAIYASSSQRSGGSRVFMRQPVRKMVEHREAAGLANARLEMRRMGRAAQEVSLSEGPQLLHRPRYKEWRRTRADRVQVH